MKGPTQSGWIFSKKWDLILFGGSVFWALVLDPLGSLFGLSAEKATGWSLTYHGVLLTFRIGMIVDFAYHILIDGPHALATLYRVYLDPTEVGRRRSLYWGAPVVLFLLLVFSTHASRSGVLRFVSYLNIFHYVRQQYGWMKMSSYKGGPVGALEKRLDAWAIYAATLCPLIWWHGHVTGDGWLFDGDLMQTLPSRWADAVFLLQIPVLGFFAGFQLKKYRRGDTLNFAKIFIVLITAFSWSGGIVGGWGGEQTFMLDILHAVPYLGLVFFYGYNKFGEENSWRAKAFSLKSCYLYYLPLVFIAFLQFDYGFRIRDGVSWASSIGLSFLLLTPVLHYVLDGFIWRSGKSNPGLARVLKLQNPSTD